MGQPITIVRVLHFTGVDPETGIYTFEDYNGDGQISAPEDRKAIIDTAPEWYGGLSNTLAYGNLELDIFFQFSKQLAQNSNRWGTTPGAMVNQPVGVLDAWTVAGDQTDTQGYTTGGSFDRVVAAYNLGQSDAAFSDATYLRLKNISLAYNIPNFLHSVSNAKVFLQGQNLYTLTEYKGQDPEQTLGFIPALRWLGAGVTVTF